MTQLARGRGDGLDMRGLVAVVTGGSSGIGLATADLFERLGLRVVVLDRSGESENLVVCDVTDQQSIDDAMTGIEGRFGRVDILVNNAGIGAQGTLEENDADEWIRVFDVNVMGIMRVTRSALGLLRRSHCASIVNTSSIAATAGLPSRVLYSATKGAVLAMTRAMAADFVREGIRVNCVSPGTVDTPFVAEYLAKASNPDEEYQAVKMRQPLGRLVTAAEVAFAISYLADPHSSATTGVSLAVDGGMDGLRVRPVAKVTSNGILG